MIALNHRVVAYFTLHPDEDITARYAADRWGVPLQTARKALEALRENGLLRRAEPTRNGVPVVYVATDDLKTLAAGR